MSQKNIVAKYGGSSMAWPKVVAGIIKSQPRQKIIVCSAPGKSDKYNHKLTDHLISLSGQTKQPTELNKVISRFEEITFDLDQEFRTSLLSKLRRDLSSRDDINFVISRGEYYSALALAERIGGKFVDAAKIFFFDSTGKLNRKKTAAAIKSRLGSGQTFVVPGFYGADSKGEICLFKRGGSDRSGAIIAASLNWNYQNWTDTDGIMNADPKVIPSAGVIRELTYEEVREGAHGGTGTLMGDSVLDLQYGEFDTILKNTFNPSAPGTMIRQTRDCDGEQPVAAISARADLLGLTIHDMGMRDRKGYLVKILKILAEMRVSIEHMPAAQDAITMTFHDEPGLQVKAIERQINQLLVSPSASASIGLCGVVYMVGENLRKLMPQHKVMIQALQTLEKNNIPVQSVMMHPDSPSIALILNHDQTIAAQKILFQKFLSN